MARRLSQKLQLLAVNHGHNKLVGKRVLPDRQLWCAACQAGPTCKPGDRRCSPDYPHRTDRIPSDGEAHWMGPRSMETRLVLG